MPQRPSQRLRRHEPPVHRPGRPKTSGKSTYIAVLVRELHERVGEAFGAALNPMDDRTDQRYENQRRELFDKGELPGDNAAVSARASLSAAVPLHRPAAGAPGLAGGRSQAPWHFSTLPERI